MDKGDDPEQKGIKLIQIGKLTISEVNGLWRDLLEQEAREIILDLEQVEECDAAGVQLLIAIGMGLTEARSRIRIKNISAALSTCMVSMGISPEGYVSS